MITLKENIENMKNCPRFESCSIPKCPLDYFMKERSELPEDKQCPLRKLITVGKRKKRIEGILSPKMRSISKFIPDTNK
jgi:hypothetical protein